MNSSRGVLHLSQSNLQDFTDCPRRFQLKVLDNIAWPAAYLEPLSHLEKSTELGNKFHQLCQQYFSGIDPDVITASISDPDLREMYDSFLPFASDLQGEESFAEVILNTPFLGHQLIAKYDLLLRTDDSRYIIFDWKTSSKKPPRSILSQRFQTFLYPYILAKTGSSIFKTNPPSPNTISMIYYYPLSSDPEEIFPYSDDLYSENTDGLTKVISDIENLAASSEVFPLTDDLSQCQRCVYRSLCDRGIHGSMIDLFTEIEQEDLSGENFDLDYIDEIGY